MATAAFWRERRVFLTGHTGFKGAWLSLMLEILNARTTGYARAPKAEGSLFDIALTGDNLCDVRGDLNDSAFLDGVFRAADPEIAFHLAPKNVNPLESAATILEAAQNCPSTQAVVIITEDPSLIGAGPFASRDFLFIQDGPMVAVACCGALFGGGVFRPDDQISQALRAFREGRPYFAQAPRARAPYAHALDGLHACLSFAERLCEEAPSSSSRLRLSAVEERPLADALDALAAAWGAGAFWRPDPACAIGSQPQKTPVVELSASASWRPTLDLAEAAELAVQWEKTLHIGAEDMAVVTRAQAERYLGQRLQFAPARMAKRPALAISA